MTDVPEEYYFRVNVFVKNIQKNVITSFPIANIYFTFFRQSSIAKISSVKRW